MIGADEFVAAFAAKFVERDGAIFRELEPLSGGKEAKLAGGSEIQQGGYVAQELMPPSERSISPETTLKADIRNYVYAGRVQLLAARLYQGQATNMRTPGGGFAPVLTTAEAPDQVVAGDAGLTCVN